MNRSVFQCPSCLKANKPDGRYCIHCGTIMRPVYCSSCGTVNPEGLPQCLECGTPVPKLSEIRWNPIVTVIQPTSGMSEAKVQTYQQEPEILSNDQDADGRPPARRLRDRLTRKRLATDD